MKESLRRAGGAAAMAVAWAAVWGLVGVLIAVFVDPDGSVDDMWVATLGLPGFFAGVIFSGVLWSAEGRRRFGELPLARAAAWGAVTGLLLGVIPFALGDPAADLPLWLLALVVVGSLTLLSALSAVGSALLFRYAARRQAPARARPEG